MRGYRFPWHALIAATIVFCGLVIPAVADLQNPLMVTVPCEADATVMSKCPAYTGGNRGYVLAVNFDETTLYEALLRFNVTQLPVSQVSRATLYLFSPTGHGACTFYHLLDASDNWDETTINWTTRPTTGDALITMTPPEVGIFTIDVTAAVNAELAAGRNRLLSLRVTAANHAQITLISREANDVTKRPFLYLE